MILDAMDHMASMIHAGYTLRASARSAARVFPPLRAVELLRYFTERP